jgi:hypothetical protein
MFDELEFSWGTPSMNVVMPGFAGLDPMPRTNGLLTRRADSSATRVLGDRTAASLTIVMPAASMTSAGTAVTLTGRRCASAGSFCAVTTTVGSVMGGTVCGWAAC